MYSMKSIDGKESNTAKGLNIATKFNEFKDALFHKNYSDIKWDKFKAKNIKWKHTKWAKYHYCVLIIKDLFWMVGFTSLFILITLLKIDSHR